MAGIANQTEFLTRNFFGIGVKPGRRLGIRGDLLPDRLFQTSRLVEGHSGFFIHAECHSMFQMIKMFASTVAGMNFCSIGSGSASMFSAPEFLHWCRKHGFGEFAAVSGDPELTVWNDRCEYEPVIEVLAMWPRENRPSPYPDFAFLPGLPLPPAVPANDGPELMLPMRVMHESNCAGEILRDDGIGAAMCPAPDRVLLLNATVDSREPRAIVAELTDVPEVADCLPWLEEPFEATRYAAWRRYAAEAAIHNIVRSHNGMPPLKIRPMSKKYRQFGDRVMKKYRHYLWAYMSDLFS